jgi:hypothetical protein
MLTLSSVGHQLIPICIGVVLSGGDVSVMSQIAIH